MTAAASEARTRAKSPALLQGSDLLEQGLGRRRSLQDGGRPRDLVGRFLDGLEPRAPLDLRLGLLVVLVDHGVAARAEERARVLLQAIELGHEVRGGGRGRRWF